MHDIKKKKKQQQIHYYFNLSPIQLILLVQPDYSDNKKHKINPSDK